MLKRRDQQPPRRERTAWDQFNAEQAEQERNVERVANGLNDEFHEMVNAPGVVQRYAGNRLPTNRIAKVLMDGSEEIEQRIAAAIDQVNETVTRTLDELQKQIDELRAATKASADAAKAALENHVAIASRAMQQADTIRQQIAEFKLAVAPPGATG